MMTGMAGAMASTINTVALELLVFAAWSTRVTL